MDSILKGCCTCIRMQSNAEGKLTSYSNAEGKLTSDLTECSMTRHNKQTYAPEAGNRLARGGRNVHKRAVSA